MSDQTEGTIAALLRHSTTSLVRRCPPFATHLKDAVETVANFGKSSPIRPDTHQAKAAQGPIFIRSATKTVTG
jgi:hypothetical protein